MAEKEKSRPIAVGLTGRMASGKGEAIKVFQNHGYHYISLSDIVREEALKSQAAITRLDMQNIGNDLRQRYGAGILGRRIRETIEGSSISRWVIDGIRNPAEIVELRKLSYFVLIGIEARIGRISERMKKRGRSTDRISENELKKSLEREWGIGEPADGQRVGDCMKMADFLIYNNSSLDDFKKRLISIIKKLEEHDEP